MKTIHVWILAFLALSLISCASSRPYIAEDGLFAKDLLPGKDIAYQVYLIGNVDLTRRDEHSRALDLLMARLIDDEQAAIVFLGAHPSCCEGGLDTTSASVMTPDVLEKLRTFSGRVLFVPDEHSWKKAGAASRTAWEHRVENALSRNDAVLPNDGFPGPKRVKLNDWITLIALDTQWWLEPDGKPYGETDGYTLNEEEDFLMEIDDLIKRERKKSLLVVGHHPIYSNGEYAGFFSLRDNLFPLTSISPALMVPMPGVGSLWPLYARYAGRNSQDLAHPRYTLLREALGRIFYQHQGLIYASGHEHNLQYFLKGPVRNQQHYLVSGAGNATRYVAAGRSAAFTAQIPGYMQLTFYQDGAVWLEVWGVDDASVNGRVLYRSELNGPRSDRVDLEVAEDTLRLDFRDSTVVAPANASYSASAFKKLLYGKYYRKTWTQPIEAPVLDLRSEAGGLQLLKRGGGFQTSSLHFQGNDLHQYVLRTIDKTTLYTVPLTLRGTVVADVVDDVMASLHPYGALLIPTLAEAAGIYHAHPRVVYVPDDPLLGIYREEFANRLMMLENRPDDDMSDDECVGHAANVVSFETLYEKIEEDNDHRVDQVAFARARLFDMLVADWDRNPKQWRWAAFEPGELDASLQGEYRTMGKIYRPIPRDRDWAFSRLDGLMPSIIKVLIPKFQGFEHRYGDLKGLTRKGLSQDRRFTAELTRDTWVALAESLQTALSDEVIDEAIAAWPESIRQLDGPSFADILKTRRDQLPQIAEAYYALNARVVDIVGSNKHERFEVDRIHEDTTRVLVYKTTNEGEIRKLIYQRTFVANETSEIRLHGMDGQDRFLIKGQGRTGILVRAIGGPGMDRFIDETEKTGGRKTAVLYVSKDDTFPATRRHTNVVRVEDPAIHQYEVLPFQYNRNRPIVALGSDREDGFYFGGGVQFIRNGFKRAPFAFSHTLRASYAPLHSAIDASYSGRYVTLLGKWHFGLDTRFSSLNHIRNFYGFGNETEERDRYQLRLGQLHIVPSVTRMMAGNASFSVSPQLSWTKASTFEDEEVFLVPDDLTPFIANDQWTAGLGLGLHIDNRDQANIPKRGFLWNNSLSAHAGLAGENDSYGMLSSELSVYLTSVRFSWLTMAFHFAGAHNVGNFPFYQANALGRKHRLLGYPRSRFIGRSSLYQSLELRARLFRYITYLTPGEAGILGAIDQGRVWADGETSDAWHLGFGIGPWVSFLDMVVVSGTYGFSGEGTSFNLRLGFRY